MTIIAPWDEVSLGDICEFRYGRSLPEAQRKGGDVPVYGSNGAVGHHDIALTGGSTIVIGRKGSFGEVNFSAVPCWPIDTTYYVDQTCTTADLRWLMHRLSAIGLTDLNRAAAVPGLNREDAYRKRLLVPPLPEQRRIAAILDQADALRAKRRAAIAQLDTLAQSIFLDMFGDPEANPNHIATAPLSELCTRITDGTHQPPRWSDSGIPFLFVSNIVSGEIDFETQKFISEDTYAELTRRCPIEAGDVLYSTVGTYGVPAMVRAPRKFAFQRHIAHLKPRREFLLTPFLCGMLASPGVKRQADRAARGVAQKTVNLADIKSFTVFCPPLDIQRSFARRVAAAESLKASLARSLAHLDALFASLQYRAFRGEL